jgi:hypothetical protein
VLPGWRQHILAPIFALCMSFIFAFLFSMALEQPKKPPEPDVSTSPSAVSTAKVEPTAPTSPLHQNSPAKVIRAEVVDTRLPDDVSIQVWDEQLLHLIREGKLNTNGSFRVTEKGRGLHVCIKAPNDYRVIVEPGSIEKKGDLSCASLIPVVPGEIIFKLSRS